LVGGLVGERRVKQAVVIVECAGRVGIVTLNGPKDLGWSAT
jgi:hypothetical protein